MQMVVPIRKLDDVFCKFCYLHRGGYAVGDVCLFVHLYDTRITKTIELRSDFAMIFMMDSCS